jgi:Uma2 family endonuclease
MTLSRSHAYFSAEEYLELEQISPIKHEYIQGEVYAMAGASIDFSCTIAQLYEDVDLDR